jgi:hypothetical protein
VRDKTQLVELDLRSGLFTNESSDAIGGGSAAGCVFDYRYPVQSHSGRSSDWPDARSPAFPTAEAAHRTRARFDIAFTANGGLPVAGNGVPLPG